MGVGSIPDSPPMPPGDTAEERERAWAAAHPPAAQPAYDSKPQVQQQQMHPPQQQQAPTGGQGLYPQPVAGIFVKGDSFEHIQKLNMRICCGSPQCLLSFVTFRSNEYTHENEVFLPILAGPLYAPAPGHVLLGYQVCEPTVRHGISVPQGTVLFGCVPTYLLTRCSCL